MRWAASVAILQKGKEFEAQQHVYPSYHVLRKILGQSRTVAHEESGITQKGNNKIASRQEKRIELSHNDAAQTTLPLVLICLALAMRLAASSVYFIEFSSMHT